MMNNLPVCGTILHFSHQPEGLDFSFSLRKYKKLTETRESQDFLFSTQGASLPNYLLPQTINKVLLSGVAKW
jgi:hypothetical protein